MKRWSVFLVLLLIMSQLAGCSASTIQKKFTRKKKEPLHRPVTVFLEEGPYQKKYSNAYYYKTHYTFWKSWHDDLIQNIGGNSKKLARSGQEALSNLESMNGYLVPEKQAEIKPLLDGLTRIVRRVEGGAYAASEEGSMRVDLERIRRLIANDFYYEKVKDQIKPEETGLETPPSGAAAPAPSA